MNESVATQYDKLRSDLEVLSADLEALIEASVDQGGSIGRRIRQTLESMRMGLVDEERALRARWAQGAKKTAYHIQQRPWSTAGIGMATLVVLGLLIWRQWTDEK